MPRTDAIHCGEAIYQCSTITCKIRPPNIELQAVQVFSSIKEDRGFDTCEPTSSADDRRKRL